MPRIIGIDLGTTNTAVAVLDGGRPRVVEDDRGYKVLPSVVSAKGDGRFVVGQAAHNLILTRPDRTVFACKRLMGRRFDSAEVQSVRKRVAFEMREAPDGGVQVKVGDQWMTPPEVGAVVLQVARTIAERSLGEAVEEAVITVPAHFNHAQRKATLESAQLAGIKCERLLNEPTAAALAYGHRKNIERTIAIFDLGGGTFDVSVLHLQNGIYEILSTAGDTFLGGDDFDWRIVEWLADSFQARTRIDLREDRTALQRLKDAAERAKCELSFSDKTNIVVPHITPQENIETTITRTQLEALTVDLVEKCLEIARKAVSEAGLQLREIEEVILVGGQTRMPRVRDMVSGVFGRDPSRSVHPEEAVAVGAAVHAANLGQSENEKVVLLDVTPFDLGIDTSRGGFVSIIERNSRVPASQTRTFATVHDLQDVVKVTVRQGASRVAAENEFLGEFLFEGLTPGPRLQTKVDVSFRIDSNGMLHVTAMEKGTGEKRNITIRNYADHARAPQLPDADQARLDAENRARIAAEGAAAAAGPAPKKQRKGILEGLLGVGRRKKQAPPPVAAPVPAAAVVGVAAVGAALSEPRDPGRDPEGTETWRAEATGENPTIELSGMEVAEDDSEAMSGAPLGLMDEELLYEETGANAGLGLAGGAVNRLRGGDPFGEESPEVHEAAAYSDGATGPAWDTVPMSMEELFGPSDDIAPEAIAALGREQGFGTARPPVDFMADEDPLDEVDAAPALTEEEDLLGGDEIDLFGDDFALLADGDDGPAPEPVEVNPFAGDDHTDIDHQALAAMASAAAVNLAAASAVAGAAEFVFTEQTAPEGMATPPPIEIAPMVEVTASGIEPLEEDALSDALAEEGPGGDFSVDLGESWVEDLSSSLGRADVAALPALPEDHDSEEGEDFVPALDLEAESDLSGLREVNTGTTFAEEDDPVALPEELLAEAEDDLGLESLDDPDGIPEDLFGADFVPSLSETGGPEEEAIEADAGSLSDLASGGPWDPPPALESEGANAQGTVDTTGFELVGAVPAAGEWAESEITRIKKKPAPASVEPGRRRKPARVKLAYRDFDVFVAEYRENLRRGGTFIRTDKPLPVGRECLFEIGAPGLDGPLVFPAVVTFVATAAPGQEAGMGVEYQLDDPGRREIERVLNRA